MDKLLLLLGFQLTQTVLIKGIDGSAWGLIAENGLSEAWGSVDWNLPGVLFDALISGTWIGRLADLGSIAVALTEGVRGLPVAMIALQWTLLVLWLCGERLLFARRLRRFETGR